MKIYVASVKDPIPPREVTLNITFGSTTWGRELSPFFLNGGYLYDDYYAENVENAWQFSKVYPCHLKRNGLIKTAYWQWAEKGWNRKNPIRYPMGKGAKPVFNLWDGEQLDYINARKQIYFPLYARAAKNTTAWGKLCQLVEKALDLQRDLYLVDFDGYNHKQLGLTLNEVIHNPNRQCGHSFVLYTMLLQKYHKLPKNIAHLINQ